MRLLLVDEDDNVRARLRHRLSASRSVRSISEAADGEQAINRARDEAPDLVILDLGLPDVVGTEVLADIRSVSPRSQIIVFTGDEVESRPDPSAIDADALIDKGDELHRLLEFLEHAARALITASVELPHDSASIRLARSFTAEHLATWGCPDLVEDATLIVSELCANAIGHAGGGCRVRLRLWQGALRIEVTDAGPGTPDVQSPPAEQPTGRGLLVVSSLATAWGIAPVDDDKVVWADLLTNDQSDEHERAGQLA